MSTPPARTPRRRWPWVAGAALAVLLGAALAVRSFFDAERVAALVLEQAGQATGLQWTASGPAQVGLFPQLGVELSGLAVRAPADAPILTAVGVEFALPWRTLFEEEVTVTGADLQQPVLDLRAWSRWRASLPEQGPPGPIELPHITGGVSVTDGQIVSGDWQLVEIALDAGTLRAGRRFELELDGVLQRNDARHDFSLSVNTIPSTPAGALELGDLGLLLAPRDGGEPWLEANGRFGLRLPTPVELTLSGRLARWPPQWPGLLPASDPPQAPRFDLEYLGTPDLQGDLVFALHRGAESLRGRFALGDVAGWLTDPQATPLPPATGQLEAGRLVFDTIQLQGVRVRLDSGDDEPAGDAPQAEP
ncbi:MAG TPA: hypothetical protein VFG21_06550 [Xanthomonadaceae bacterium]|nr:hypothetical protein [Xanthomonadaceae bacterium]